MRTLTSFLVAVFVAVIPVVAQSVETELATFKVSDDTEFAHYREPLVDYLRSRHVTRGTRVCILGEQASDGSKLAWVIWSGGNSMILWGGGESSMISSRRILNLKRDVVASETDVAGSTYLVTRAWVSKQQARCDEYGVSVEISSPELKK